MFYKSLSNKIIVDCGMTPRFADGPSRSPESDRLGQFMVI